jgi:hypothetical protein
MPANASDLYAFATISLTSLPSALDHIDLTVTLFDDTIFLSDVSTNSLIKRAPCYAGANFVACPFNSHTIRLWAAP